MSLEKTRRRWYQFSLRTFFVLVTLVCLVVGYWVHWAKEWKRLRDEALNSGLVTLDISGDRRRQPLTSPPLLLWPFASYGYAGLLLTERHREAEMRRLFPEAEIIWIDDF